MPKAIQGELRAGRRLEEPPSSEALDPRALPTDQELERGERPEILQQRVQGVPVLRRDGVLVLEQELG